jgi:F-type H+-transporting ATPase subunit delta
MADSEASHVPYDPGQQQLGSVYAKALLGATEKAGNSEQVLSELDSVMRDVLPALPRLRALLVSPRIPASAKESVLDKTFGGRMTSQLLHFLKVVSRHGRMDCLGAIHATAHQQFNDLRGRVAVSVRTATPLDDTLREQIRERLSQALRREVVLDCHVDASLIGGMLIRVGDTVYDSSIVNRLTRIKQQTVNRAGHAIRDAGERFTQREPVGGDPAA